MPKIDSKLNPRGEDFKANDAAMQAAVAGRPAQRGRSSAMRAWKSAGKSRSSFPTSTWMGTVGQRSKRPTPTFTARRPMSWYGPYHARSRGRCRGRPAIWGPAAIKQTGFYRRLVET